AGPANVHLAGYHPHLDSLCNFALPLERSQLDPGGCRFTFSADRAAGYGAAHRHACHALSLLADRSVARFNGYCYLGRHLVCLATLSRGHSDVRQARHAARAAALAALLVSGSTNSVEGSTVLPLKSFE